MHGSSGCLGHCSKPKIKAMVDRNPSEGLLVQQGESRARNKHHSISEDFWTTSTCDIEHSAGQSQGSMSSISTTNQLLDPHGGESSSAKSPSEFINHGLLLWNQTRQCWVGNKRLENRKEQIREPKLNWNATYESLLGSNKPFPQPIPLGEMVDFLVDIWEQEGMYD